MSSARTRQRNNTLAGFFVLLAIAGFVMTVITLSDITSLGGKQILTIAFPMDVGVPGLEVGSDVTIAGIKVGKVTAVEPHFDVGSPPTGGSNTEPSVIVKVTIPDTYKVYKDAFAGLVIPLIGSGTMIDITPLGSEGAPVDESTVLKGGFAPSIMLKSAGIGPDEIGKIKTIIARVDTISSDVQDVTTFVRTRVDQDGDGMVNNIKVSLDNIRSVIADIKDAFPDWKTRFNDILAKVQATTDRGPELAQKANDLMDNVNGRVDEIGHVVHDAAPNIQKASENIASITDRVKNETMDKFTRILDQADTGLAEATATVKSINDNLTTEMPEISRILANLRLSSDNVKLASIEIRSQPWRILYTPKPGEVKESMLNDAVRTYASAVSDLQASVDSLQALHTRYGDKLDPANTVVQKALTNFEDRLSTYQQEQKRWQEILFSQDPEH